MILIDRVLRFGDEDVETLATVRPGLFSQDDGSLPAWVGVELMAQSIAAYAGCQARQAGFPWSWASCSAPATINATSTAGRRRAAHQRHPHAAGRQRHGRVRMPPGRAGPHGLARLNVFRPPQVASYLEEPQP